jgi:replication factor C subunit 2/4
MFAWDATSIFNNSTTMAVTKGETAGESSTAAAKKLLKPNANGIANYELPW